jgi:autophagy-related protein 11
MAIQLICQAVSALNDLTSAQTPFLIAQDHILHLQSLYLTQSKALAIAYQNLLHHTSHLRQTFTSFSKTAETRLDAQEELIRSAKGDMAMLPKIIVNEGIMRVKDKVGMGEGGKRSMSFWVDSRKMEQVREACVGTHGAFLQR